MELESVVWKIEYYMQNYIMPYFSPEKIHWYFSVSGGKDSFVLADLIYQWYRKHNKHMTATGLHIIQWDDSKIEIEKRFNWLDDLLFLDARAETCQMVKSSKFKQIACGNCSKIRKACSDAYFSKTDANKYNMVNILCRGLHLTDMANSLLWRLLWEQNPIRSIISKNKGKPIVKLFDNLYLAKPLCFFREFESQSYAHFFQYKPFQCNCPALTYPGRRDIIEESVTLFYSNLLWEFNIQGMDLFFSNVLKCDKKLIMERSLPGKERKNPTLPEEYFQFALEYFSDITDYNKDKIISFIKDSDDFMEDYMPAFLLDGKIEQMKKLNPNFKLLMARGNITQLDKRMIATLGPLWGCLALNKASRERALKLQKEIYNFHLTSTWTQVSELLDLYYKR